MAKKPTVLAARVLQIISLLKREYPEAHCYLHFETPFQLLVATILSAQCTDDRVNKVTPALFARFPDAESMAKGKLSEIEKLISSTGFFRMKAKSLSETSRVLMETYGGELPRSLEKLTALRGVGRKTANVVLGNAFGIPGMVVDTHVGRLTRRMGLTLEKDPVKVEADLEKLVPRDDWVAFSHLLIAHGRAICTARKAKCDECFLYRFCDRRMS
jgi:endonuclease III